MDKTKEEAYAFLVRAGIIRPNERTLEGKEREQILLLLALMEPYEQTNNQRSWTDHYMIGKKEYRVHYFPEDENPVVEEISNE